MLLPFSWQRVPRGLYSSSTEVVGFKMRLKVYVIVGALSIAGAAFLSFSLKRAAFVDSKQEIDSPNSIKLGQFRFPIEVVSNDVKHGTYVDIRFLFLHVDSLDFTEQNLNDLFRTLGEEYQDPELLQITAYSDREMLQRAINRTKEPNCAVWSVDSLPAPSGYFAAQYSRQDDAEFFDFNVDLEEPVWKRVCLKRQIPNSWGFTLWVRARERFQSNQ